MAWTNPLAGIITSVFGTARGRYPHSGTDIAPRGGAVWVGAANDGTVIGTRTNSYRGDRRSGLLVGRTGNSVLIDHGGGIRTYYGHLATVSVVPGQVVRAGQALGRVGATGNVTGVHLHFEILINGRAINPQPYMAARGAPLGHGRTSGTGPVSYRPAPRQMWEQNANISFVINATIPSARDVRPVRIHPTQR